MPRSKNSPAIPLLPLRAFVAYEKGEICLLSHAFTRINASLGATCPYNLFLDLNILRLASQFILFTKKNINYGADL
jgi:hypothetical protein